MGAEGNKCPFLPALHPLLEQGWALRKAEQGFRGCSCSLSLFSVKDPLTMHGDTIPKGVCPHTEILAADLSLISSFARGASIVEPPLFQD